MRYSHCAGKADAAQYARAASTKLSQPRRRTKLVQTNTAGCATGHTATHTLDRKTKTTHTRPPHTLGAGPSLILPALCPPPWKPAVLAC
eukprot:3587926-Rhodomonas_salina.2